MGSSTVAGMTAAHLSLLTRFRRDAPVTHRASVPSDHASPTGAGGFEYSATLTVADDRRW